jgi:hypothetical protein
MRRTDSSYSLGDSDTLLSSTLTPHCLALRREREEQGEEQGEALTSDRQQHAWERQRREGSLVTGGGMLERSRGERTGGARGGWKQLAIMAARVGSKWNEREAERGIKLVKNP